MTAEPGRGRRQVPRLAARSAGTRQRLPVEPTHHIATAARLHTAVRRSRGREIDLAIAACAIVHDAALWTLNAKEFDDVPGLALYDAE